MKESRLSLDQIRWSLHDKRAQTTVAIPKGQFFVANGSDSIVIVSAPTFAKKQCYRLPSNFKRADLFDSKSKFLVRNKPFLNPILVVPLDECPARALVLFCDSARKLEKVTTTNFLCCYQSLRRFPLYSIYRHEGDHFVRARYQIANGATRLVSQFNRNRVTLSLEPWRWCPSLRTMRG